VLIKLPQTEHNNTIMSNIAILSNKSMPVTLKPIQYKHHTVSEWYTDPNDGNTYQDLVCQFADSSETIVRISNACCSLSIRTSLSEVLGHLIEGIVLLSPSTGEDIRGNMSLLNGCVFVLLLPMPVRKTFHIKLQTGMCPSSQTFTLEFDVVLDFHGNDEVTIDTSTLTSESHELDCFLRKYQNKGEPVTQAITLWQPKESEHGCETCIPISYCQSTGVWSITSTVSYASTSNREYVSTFAVSFEDIAQPIHPVCVSQIAANAAQYAAYEARFMGLEADYFIAVATG
jgi:hypothetical protein